MKEVEVEKKKRSTLPSRRRRLWKQFNQLTFASSLIFLSRAAAARSNASTPTGLGLPLKSLCTPCWSEPMPATMTLMSTKGSADSPGIFWFFKARAASFSWGKRKSAFSGHLWVEEEGDRRASRTGKCNGESSFEEREKKEEK